MPFFVIKTVSFVSRSLSQNKARGEKFIPHSFFENFYSHTCRKESHLGTLLTGLIAYFGVELIAYFVVKMSCLITNILVYNLSIYNLEKSNLVIYNFRKNDNFILYFGILRISLVNKMGREY